MLVVLHKIIWKYISFPLTDTTIRQTPSWKEHPELVPAFFLVDSLWDNISQRDDSKDKY